MGRNAQRRRSSKLMARFLRSIREPSKSQKLSTLSQAYQDEHPEVIFNRAARRQAGAAKRG